MKKITVREAINTLTAMYGKDVFSFNWHFAESSGAEFFALKGDDVFKTLTRTDLFFYPKKCYNSLDSFDLEANVLNYFLTSIFLYPEDNEISLHFTREG